jgi:membrane protein implicated in regulation of membrane protease activity
MSTLTVLDWCFFASLALGATFGVGTLLGGGAESPDVDVGSGAADTDLDLGGETDAEVGAASPVEAWWSALGIGRAPLGLLLTIDLLLFGGLGLVASTLFGSLLPASVASLLALPLAVVGAPLLGGRLVGVFVRHLPALETYGATPDDLVGRRGVAELRIDELFGRAKVKDHGGALHLVRCTTPDGTIEPGTEVVLTDRNPTTGTYAAERWDRIQHGRARRRLG